DKVLKLIPMQKQTCADRVVATVDYDLTLVSILCSKEVASAGHHYGQALYHSYSVRLRGPRWASPDHPWQGDLPCSAVLVYLLPDPTCSGRKAAQGKFGMALADGASVPKNLLLLVVSMTTAPVWGCMAALGNFAKATLMPYAISTATSPLTSRKRLFTESLSKDFTDQFVKPHTRASAQRIRLSRGHCVVFIQEKP
ncbi:40S ribosomal protein S2, partial [Galemys pyrenaicus]